MWEWLTGEPPYPIARRSIVHTKTDKSIRGVIWRRAGRYLVVRNAEILKGSSASPIDGDVVIDEREIDFIQVLDTGG